ncbi:hypothetical protein IQ06DRAFT_67428 [Phaeosphaeriaceae sp. SRC1lsM3a]|nr:hypothetical protein IQ06DRAFT_67428 [Stagonospora sp. SRC1lsM3a]
MAKLSSPLVLNHHVPEVSISTTLTAVGRAIVRARSKSDRNIAWRHHETSSNIVSRMVRRASLRTPDLRHRSDVWGEDRQVPTPLGLIIYLTLAHPSLFFQGITLPLRSCHHVFCAWLRFMSLQFALSAPKCGQAPLGSVFTWSHTTQPQ